MYNILGESAKLRALRALAPAPPTPSLIRALRACAPTPLIHHYYAPARLRTLRACASLLTNMRLTRLFWSCAVVSIVRYTLRLKNPRKATGPDFIPLKFIKFASKVIDSHLYNIVIKDLEKTST